MDEATREAVCGAAVRAAKAVNYEGAGTIEFIADASKGLRADRIWFMEMNTRLQVEHPVTEEITGQDLVEWQLRVASGEKLPKKQDELSINGWAIEARLYAEDPAKGFLPSVGRLEHLRLPERFRVDSGVAEGDEVSSYYDPMIAKIVSWAEDRPNALQRLSMAFWRTGVAPLRTNAGFLYRALQLDAFQEGDLHTGLLAEHIDELAFPGAVKEQLLDDATTALVASCVHNDLTIEPGVAIDIESDEKSPWSLAIGFRLNQQPSRTVVIQMGGETVVRQLPENFETRRVHSYFGDAGTLSVMRRGETLTVSERFSGSVGAGVADGEILAPMPGKVTSVDVSKGDKVAKGQRLLTLEAMKMEHGLVAPFDGVVAELNAKPGAQVQVDAVLAVVEPAEQ